MRCPKCGEIEDKVIDSRLSKDGDSIRRRRECIACSFRFTTYEQVDRADMRVIKRDGRGGGSRLTGINSSTASPRRARNGRSASRFWKKAWRKSYRTWRPITAARF